MPEVRPQDDGFVVFDTEADEPVMRFADRHGAGRLIGC